MCNCESPQYSGYAEWIRNKINEYVNKNYVSTATHDELEAKWPRVAYIPVTRKKESRGCWYWGNVLPNQNN